MRHVFESEHRLFSQCITGVVLTGRFSSVPAVVLQLATFQGGRIDYQPTSGSAAGLTQRSSKSFAYIQVVDFRSAI